MIDVRLVAYAPNGNRLGPLPHPLSLNLGQPLDDLPSLTVSYSTHSTGAELLAAPVEVAAELYAPDTGVWTEHPDSRFLRLARSGDATDPTGARSYTMPGYGWQGRKIRLYPPADPDDLVDGKRGFLSATAGTILATFLQEWHARSGATEFAYDFTTATDSAGATWDKVLTIYYAPGIDLLTVLGNLADQGVCDWRFNGRTLQVFNADTTLGRNLATGPDSVDLLVGRDITDAPDTASLEDLVTDVYLQGEGGFALQAHNAAAVSPWGRWEDYITQGGVRDSGTATILASAALASGSAERVQITRGLTFGRAEHLPWRDYRPGDHVRAAADDGTPQSLRVRQVTLSRDGDGQVSGNVVLNDRFVEGEIRRARRTQSIVNGATASGGSGAQPAPEGPDTRRPAAPAGLIVDTVDYLDSDGAARGQITATWGLVDTATDGTAMEIGAYELYHRPNVVDAPWYKATETVDPDNTAWYSGYNVGEEWAFKVRAIGQHNSLPGPFSDQYAVTIAADTDPPPVPSAPVLSTRLGVIHVNWDGLGSAGEPMPADYQHTIVQMRDADPWVHTFDYTGPPQYPFTVSEGTWNGTAEGMPFAGYGNFLLYDFGTVDQVVELDVYRPPGGAELNLFIAPRVDGVIPSSGYFSPYIAIGSDLPAGQSTTYRVEVIGQRARVIEGGQVIYDQSFAFGNAYGTQMALDGDSGTLLSAWRIPADVDWHEIDVMEGGPATVVIPGQPYGAERWVRLIAVDRSGNTSAASAVASAATEPLVDTDVHPEVIAAGHIRANAVTADKIEAGAIEAGHIAANAIEADKIAAGAIDGKTITGATVRSARPASGGSATPAASGSSTYSVRP
ncbi:hypothetical protein BJF83_17280 [Nocardiopsis sp. CNR-923]|uniref:hypothetical protein n=1 Tax=Nocardiopsis sp. CNR-923 TaxID=1904965 RepID=UPI00095DF124|nr:hypothetical protein [Nocardiopsis sp. CNR-923]OLT27739.1 hypothetical protein BJF83_17280 [Nocardiopsis sp. CNR-923]